MLKTKKEEILEVARKVFAYYGYRSTTIEKIAEELRKSKTVIYHYFKDKFHLFKEVIEYEAEKIKEYIINEIKNVNDPIDKLKVYVIVRMKMLKELTNFYQALKKEYFDNLPEIIEIRKKFDLDELKIIEKILKEGKRKKILTIKHLRLTALAILSAIKGLEQPLLLKKYKIESLINYFFEILCYGILAQKNAK